MQFGPVFARIGRPAGGSVAALCLVLGSACNPTPPPASSPAPAVDNTVPRGPSELAPDEATPSPSTGAAVSPGLRWLGISGGGNALATQVSLEQDLGLLQATFGPAGQTLFAGGAGTRGVVVSGEDTPLTTTQALRLALGDFLAPHNGRDGVVRAPTIAVDGATDPVTVEVHVRSYVATPSSGARLLYLGGHGEPTTTPLGTGWTAWGHETIPIATWIAWLQEHRPTAEAPLVVVNTLCFGGGMTELVFMGGYAKAGLFDPSLCAFSATTADAPASGCDPNPDRAAQDGYALHVFHALQGRDRDGEPAATSPDLDADGRITLLEAHMHAIVGLTGPDVPLTSSDAFLAGWAVQAPPGLAPAGVGDLDGTSTPELRWVIDTLSDQLQVRPDADAATLQGHIEALGAQLDQLDLQLLEEADREETAWWDARAALLNRWPELEDPWRPDFETVLQTEGSEIQRFLDEASTMLAWQSALQRSDALAFELARVEARLARFRRLWQVRQSDTLLRQLPANGPDRAHFQALLECERAVWRDVHPSQHHLPSPPN